MSFVFKVKILLGIAIVLAVGFIGVVPAISQNPDYHHFADTWSFLGISNFFNVASNVPFLIVGYLGVSIVITKAKDASPPHRLDMHEVLPAATVFIGAMMVAFGSAFYHLRPDNITLMVDRFTMTISFMGILSLIIAERIHKPSGVGLLPLLLSIGMASVIFWIAPELNGNTGDLRPYFLVQFLSLIIIFLILLMFPATYTKQHLLYSALGLYVLAKMFEDYDLALYEMFGNGFSGHTLKHLTAGLAIYQIVRYVKQRESTPENQEN